MANENQLGWISIDEMTDYQRAIHESNLATMPVFDMPVQDTPAVGTKILLTDTWKHDMTVQALGFAFTGWYQFTGSCVGVGGGNAQQTLNCVESCLKADVDAIVLQAWWFNYGQSRKRGGLRGQGSGSFGSTYAKSLELDGTCDGDLADLGNPEDYRAKGMSTIGRNNELQWSDGNHPSSKVREEAKPHPIQCAFLNSGNQVRDSIVNGYPVTRAGGVYVASGGASVRNGARIGGYNGRGGHQTSWLGYWNHPDEGELIFEQNQWGQSTYGADPGGGPLGGCWVRMRTVDDFTRGRGTEVYALSQYEGYPERPEVFDWMTNSFWS